MKKFKFIFIFIIMFLLVFTFSCKKKTHTHDYFSEASYFTPPVCKTCGEMIGTVLQPTTLLSAHLDRDYISVDATCRINIDDVYDFSNYEVVIEKDDIITCNEFGVITALSVGKSKLAVVNKTDKLNFIVLEIEVITKQPIAYCPYARMDKGYVAPIYIENFDDLKESSLNDFNISFTKGNIVEVNANNELVATGYGLETVVLTSKLDNRITSKFQIEVSDASTSLVIRGKDNTGLAKVGEQFQMIVANDLYKTSSLSWSSSNNNIAVVNTEGFVTIKQEGDVTIIAKDENAIGDTTKIVTYTITIKDKIEVDYIARLIHTALAENGTHEEGNNRTKYGEWYPNNGNAWCAMFVSWCWYFSGLSNDILVKYQGCSAGLQWCAENGIANFVQDFTINDVLYHKTTYKPVSGDIVFFLSNNASHTGIVIYSDDTYLYTIEGNTSDQVAIKRWLLSDSKITAYAHPKYPDYSGTREDFSWIAQPKGNGEYWWSNSGEKPKLD